MLWLSLFHSTRLPRRDRPWSYAAQGRTVRRFAANSDPNPQLPEDPQNSPPPNSLLGTILFYRCYDSHPSPMLQVRKINVQRGKVTSPRWHSQSKRIWSFAGIMLLLLTFVGLLGSLTETWVVVWQETCFPCQAPIDWMVRVLPANTQVSGHSSQSIRAQTGRRTPLN